MLTWLVPPRSVYPIPTDSQRDNHVLLVDNAKYAVLLTDLVSDHSPLSLRNPVRETNSLGLPLHALLTACAACVRTARFEGRDISTVVCNYEGHKSSGGGTRKKKGKKAANATEEEETEEPAEGDRQSVRGTMADLLNGSSGGEAASNSICKFRFIFAVLFTRLEPSLSRIDPLPLPNPMPSSRFGEPSRTNSWDSVNSGIATSSLALPHHFAPTPPLSYSSASTPEEMLVPSPPSTAASPAPSTFAHPAASTSSHGYPYPLPPMYAPSTQAVTSAPLQHYPPPALDHSSYFDSLRRSNPNYPRLPPLAPPQPSPHSQHFSYFTRYDPNRIYGTSSSQPIISRPPYDHPAPTTFNDQTKMPNSMYIPPPSLGLPVPPPIRHAQPSTYHDHSSFPTLNYPTLSRPQSVATPTDPTFSLPYGYPSPGVQKEGSVTTPGFNDIDSWLRGLAP